MSLAPPAIKLAAASRVSRLSSEAKQVRQRRVL